MAVAAARLVGKRVLITGGSRGLGLGLVKQFLERDSRVIATTRNPASAEQLQQLAKDTPKGSLEVAELDTSSLDSIKAWAALMKEKDEHVDVLINNAGVYGRRLAFSEFEPEDFMSAFNTNALGPFFVTQQLHRLGLIGGAKPTLIVNMSSIVASHGDKTVSSASGGGYAYRASKAALNIINKSLALDLEPQGVTSVLIHPGYVSTDMTDYKGWISVDESVTGIMSVLESGREVQGRFFAYDGNEIPW